MIDSLIVGLVLALTSGVTFVAYKHPTGYKRNFSYLAFYGGMVAMFPLLWGILDLLYAAALIHSAANKYPAMQVSTLAGEIIKMVGGLRQIGITTGVYLGSLLYLFFLRKLPDLLRNDGEGDAKERA